MRSSWMGALCASLLFISGCFFGDLGERPTLDPKYLDAGGAEGVEASDAGVTLPIEVSDAGDTAPAGALDAGGETPSEVADGGPGVPMLPTDAGGEPSDDCATPPYAPQGDCDDDGVPNGDDCYPDDGNRDHRISEDQDCDEVPDEQDNCPQEANYWQTDSDNDGIGDVCDTSNDAGVAQVADAGLHSGADGGLPLATPDAGHSVMGECGDGVVQPSLGENCDDGNTVDETDCFEASCEFCSSDCTEWIHFYCGDGIETSAEACDEGLNNGSDTCDYGLQTCQVCKSDCSGQALVTGRYCGDGVHDVVEEACDDGNEVDSDGCHQCEIAPGCLAADRTALYLKGHGPTEDAVAACVNLADTSGTLSCMTNSLPVSATCAGCFATLVNGSIEALCASCGPSSENPVGNPFSDACFGCQKNAGLIPTFEACTGLVVDETTDDDDIDTCLYFPNVGDEDSNGVDDACESYCGDGDVDFFEACDDGNTSDNDGCSATCQLEAGWVCEEGEPCTLDTDEDGIPNDNGGVADICLDGETDNCSDNCPNVPNPDQADTDGDGDGDACDDPVCGNGYVETGEACDDGQESDLCNANCTQSVCGDGIVNVSAGETCDDGSDNSMTVPDSCRSNCVAATCGDQVTDTGEGCDDGNDNDDDGCTSSCVLTEGWDCSSGTCVTSCGDGLIAGNEACDDGDTLNNDGCSATCEVESGYECAGTPSVCSQSNVSTLCTDGVVSEYNGKEYHFCPNATNRETAQATCEAGGALMVKIDDLETNQAVWDGIGDLPPSGSTSGEHLYWLGLSRKSDNTWGEWEDGEALGGYFPYSAGGANFFNTSRGCAVINGTDDATYGGTWHAKPCADSYGYICEKPAAEEPVCGNGTVETSENCDEGENNSCDCAYAADEANSQCGDLCCNCTLTPGRPHYCGDYFVDENEECDQGPNNSDTIMNRCRTNCTSARCGDGVIDSGENCDDGNVLEQDGCSAACQVEQGWTCDNDGCSPICGDGLVTGAEECDPGGSETTVCDVDCTAAQCGDGTLNNTAGEGCDDGNDNDDDGCTSSCELTDGWDCSSGTCVTVCGDGLIAGDEACDDMANENGDGCSATCEVESGYTCVGSPSTCSLQETALNCDYANSNTDDAECIYTDNTTGLMWQGCPAGQTGENCAGDPAEFNHANAMTYCEDLTWGGFDDWALPNIDEVRTLITNCEATASNGTCEINDSCSLSGSGGNNCTTSACPGCDSAGNDDRADGFYLPFDFSGTYGVDSDDLVLWSSSLYQDGAFASRFKLGNVGKHSSGNMFQALCVRDPDIDGDTIPTDDGDETSDPCAGGDTENCDDNCPNDANADQADADNDGIGDVCEPAVCDNGNVLYFAGNEYHFCPSPTTRESAKQVCETGGASLVKIESTEENNWLLQNAVAQAPLDGAENLRWIGLTRSDDDSWGVWDDGSSLGDFNLTCCGSDLNDLTRQCMSMIAFTDAYEGYWGAKICSLTSPYICEKQL